MSKLLFNDDFYCKVEGYSDNKLDISYGMEEEGYFKVSIPHDALIHDFDKFYKDHVIWYKKRLGIDPCCNQKYIVYFEGVYMDATIYINDTMIGKWVNGFTSFMFDITSYVKSKDDVIYVSINYRNPNARWYAGPGINRDVYLYIKNESYIVPDSFCSGIKKLNTTDWSLLCDIEIYNAKTTNKVKFSIDELNLSKVIPVLSDSQDDTITIKTDFIINNPNLWDINSPILYSLKIELLDNDETIDEEIQRIGFRNIDFDTDRGLFLNGKHIKIKGVCLHSDGGCLGTAFDKEYARRQLLIMKEMGANAIRNSHNVQAPDFLNLCDELGFLVMGEAFDQWRMQKTEYDYARFFDDWYEKDIASWIRRDRNHPSIFMWSAGNEIYDTHAGIEGKHTLDSIVSNIKKHDKYSHAPVTLCSNYMQWSNTQNAVDDLRLVGYNYGEYLYDEHHAKHPEWYIFGSETASCVQSRDIYHFPYSVTGLDEVDLQCSSLGNCSTSWGAPDIDFCMSNDRKNKYSLGQFLWTGIDYLGEPTPYHTKNSYFGMTDTAGFPKDSYYICQSEWLDPEVKPMIHIFPYWDYNDGQIIDVRVCSNLSCIELFFNDESYGRKYIDHINGDSLCVNYQLPYSKGTIKAIAYDENNNAVVTDTISSFEDTYSFKLSENNINIVEGDTRLRCIEVQAIDINGINVRNATDRVIVSVNGPGEIVGIDNGNSTDYESYKSNVRKLFNGKLLVLIKPTGVKGQIIIDIRKDDNDTPVRKIEIKNFLEGENSYSNNILTKEAPTVMVEVCVYPENAKINEIKWEITNERGVQIKNAKIRYLKEDNSIIAIDGISDGDFVVRCLHINQNGSADLISCMNYKCEGFGDVFVNPYDFISASLYSSSSENIGNGNEKGIATSNFEDSYVIYENIDFGSRGSDLVTIPIFELSNSNVDISLWNGNPNLSETECLGTFVYNKKSIWNVYQEDTFRLNRKLKGVNNFAIKVNTHKIHIKGFIFEEDNKASSFWYANKASKIYGDSFNITDESVNEIGNNVFLSFEKIDFEKSGYKKIAISGRSNLDKNTIHIRFATENNNEEKRMVEFIKCSEFEEQIFDLEPFYGIGDLSFVFLPGSNFDFKYFRFIKE